LNQYLEVTDPEIYFYEGGCLKEVEKIGLNELVKIKPHKEQFLFRLETTGALSASEIIEGAFKYLIGKLREMIKEVERIMWQNHSDKKSKEILHDE